MGEIIEFDWVDLVCNDIKDTSAYTVVFAHLSLRELSWRQDLEDFAIELLRSVHETEHSRVTSRLNVYSSAKPKASCHLTACSEVNLGK